MDVAKILVLLTLVIYVMGLLRALLTPGEGARDACATAPAPARASWRSGLGAVTPFCSCSSIPLFIGFVEAGIPLGVTLSFLIASPMVNEVAVVVLAGGHRLADDADLCVDRPVRRLRSAASCCSASSWSAGSRTTSGKSTWARRRRGRAGQQPARPPRLCLDEVREIVGRIWKFILIGVGIGAVIHGYVPADFVAASPATAACSRSIVAVLVGVPMYSDAVGIIPVAEALLGKGVPLGTVLAFMMAVIALSLPEMMILRKVVKGRCSASSPPISPLPSCWSASCSTP